MDSASFWRPPSVAPGAHALLAPHPAPLWPSVLEPMPLLVFGSSSAGVKMRIDLGVFGAARLGFVPGGDTLGLVRPPDSTCRRAEALRFRLPLALTQAQGLPELGGPQDDVAKLGPAKTAPLATGRPLALQNGLRRKGGEWEAWEGRLTPSRA